MASPKKLTLIQFVPSKVKNIKNLKIDSDQRNSDEIK